MATERFTDDPRRSEARRLRMETRLSLAQLRDHFGVSRDTMADWLWGLPTPEWTLRPMAKDGLRGEAVELRQRGFTVPVIAEQLGVSKSSAYHWVKHVPLEGTAEGARQRRSQTSKRVAQARWEPLNRARDTERAAVNESEAEWVGELSNREVRLLGVVAYWCEGQKAKPWQPNRCRAVFINSDPALILLFVRFVELLGEPRSTLKYRVSIHESADVDGANHWWADLVGVPVDQLRPPTLKRHNPSTVRYNVGEPYRGCLVIEVPKSRRLYWKIEGVMRGVGLASRHGTKASTQ